MEYTLGLTDNLAIQVSAQWFFFSLWSSCSLENNLRSQVILSFHRCFSPHYFLPTIFSRSVGRSISVCVQFSAFNTRMFSSIFSTFLCYQLSRSTITPLYLKEGTEGGELLLIFFQHVEAQKEEDQLVPCYHHSTPFKTPPTSFLTPDGPPGRVSTQLGIEERVSSFFSKKERRRCLL